MTKADKPRSLKITQKMGSATTLGIKAKVLNKIVREASGVHNYTLVPPVSQPKEAMSTDPDTHPLMKPYREQTNRNPIMCSFGHRPKSASRTFHPGTMKVRMKKGEVAAVNPSGNGFGLPPYVLAKILNAPKLNAPNTLGTDSDIDTNAKRLEERSDPNGLFLSHEELFGDTFSTAPGSKTERQSKKGKKGTLRSSSGNNIKLAPISSSQQSDTYVSNTIFDFV
jgi:hypothetical protein